MAHIGTGEFAAAVSEAGGIGQIAAGGMTPEQLEEAIDIVFQRTNKAFGVNIMLMNPHADAMAQIIADKKVPLVTTGAGNPAKYIEMWREKGIETFPVISSPALARRMERFGASGVIAEGNEAGGHIGKMTTMTLLPQVVDVVDIPVIGAGGFASGKQILAGEVLGAAAFQIGTAFLVTEECPIHDKFKEKLLNTSDNHITVIGETVGAPIRVVRNTMTREYLAREKEGASFEELEVYTLGALRDAVIKGDIDKGSLMAGLVSPQLKEIQCVESMMKNLYDDYQREREKYCENWK